MTACPTTDQKPPALSLLLGEEALCLWLGEARPGGTIAYHCGHLALDRARIHTRLSEKDRRELSAIANRVANLADEGRLILTQSRVGPDEFRYVATKPLHPAERCLKSWRNAP